jgi:hypothetical protein
MVTIRVESVVATPYLSSKSCDLVLVSPSILSLILSYSSSVFATSIAPTTGQAFAHAPQETHLLLSIVNDFASLSQVNAFVGQTGMPLQSSELSQILN